MGADHQGEKKTFSIINELKKRNVLDICILSTSVLFTLATKGFVVFLLVFVKNL